MNKTIVFLTWIILALVLALRFGYGQVVQSMFAKEVPLKWTVVGVEDLGQELESTRGTARQTTARFILIQITVANESGKPAEFPGFNLLTPDKGTIFPHLGNLALVGLCSPRVLAPDEVLGCGQVFELREAVRDGVVVMSGNGEAGVTIP